MNSDLLDLIDLVIEKKRQAARYYQAMAGLVPEHEANWRRLGTQKEGHVVALLRVREIVAERPQEFKPGKFQAVTVRRMIRDVSDMVEDIRGGRVNAQYALSFAGDMERSLLEKGLDGLLETTVPEVVEILGSLKTETGSRQELLVLEALEEHGPVPVDVARVPAATSPDPILPRPTLIRPTFRLTGPGGAPLPGKSGRGAGDKPDSKDGSG